MRIVAHINALFAVDAEARTAKLDHAARHALRSKKAPAILAEIQAEITAAQAIALPASALGKACHYTLALWQKLTRFLDYPELELSNNCAENSMRPVALGRKNWIHIGSEQAGPKVAAILSVVETCRRINIPVREYLAAVLPGLADVPIQHLAQLTPTTWSAHKLLASALAHPVNHVVALTLTTEELWKEIGEVLNTVTPSECANYFASSGYVCT